MLSNLEKIWRHPASSGRRAFDLESEVNLRAHFVAGVVEVVELRICVQRLGWICKVDASWICGESASRICCYSLFCISLDLLTTDVWHLRFAKYP